MTNKSTAQLQPYEIVSVQQAAPPSGAKGSNWHRYVIVQGSNTIHGYRQGNLEAVMTAVEENVAQLNERQMGKSGRANVVPVTKKKTNN